VLLNPTPPVPLPGGASADPSRLPRVATSPGQVSHEDDSPHRRRARARCWAPQLSPPTPTPPPPPLLPTTTKAICLRSNATVGGGGGEPRRTQQSPLPPPGVAPEAVMKKKTLLPTPLMTMRRRSRSLSEAADRSAEKARTNEGGGRRARQRCGCRCRGRSPPSSPRRHLADNKASPPPVVPPVPTATQGTTLLCTSSCADTAALLRDISCRCQQQRQSGRAPSVRPMNHKTIQ
jgi:hypothetical protein